MNSAKKTRRDFLKTLGLGAVSLVVLGCNDVYGRKKPRSNKLAKNSRPNILYIMSDDHTATAIGSYGSRLAKITPTKNIDLLAKDGMLMENVFCTNSICTPSRATILTGQYSQANDVLTLNGRLKPENQHLPKLMKKAGYTTAMIGKWHLKEEPAAFDYYNVLPGQGKYHNPTFYETGDPWEKNPKKHTGHSSDVITDISLKWLDSRDKTKPFFLMHHFKAPHDMFENAHRFDSLFEDVDIPEPENLWITPVHHSAATKGMGTSVSKRCKTRNMGKSLKIDKTLPDKEYTHQAYQLYLKRYLRCVAGVDENVGRLLDYLKKENLLDNTIIIYTADQGFMLGEHDYIDKRWMYEESLRMPFIVRYPKMIKKGQRSDEIVNNTDFAPTILDLAGAKAPGYMHGKSIVPILAGKTPADWRKSTYYRYWQHMAHHRNPSHFGVRTKKYKLIFFYGCSYRTVRKSKKDKKIYPKTQPGWELYDIKKDPTEMNNLYGNRKYASVIKELKNELLSIRKKYNETDEKYPHIQKIIDEYWDK